MNGTQLNLKAFFPAKKTINKMKRPPTEWRKYLQTGERQEIHF